MITKEELAERIKENIKDAPFDGCSFIDLDCTDKNSNELYLVFACDKDENGETNLYCKLAYNCDDLQCDYAWDWEMPEDIEPYECDYCNKWSGRYTDEAAEWIVDYLLVSLK